MTKNSIIRTIYLYLFAVLGLALLTVGGVQIINLGLKMTVFRQADNTFISRPLAIAIDPDKAVEEEKVAVEEINYVTQNRQRQASMALALLIIGLPLYLYHWSVIKKEIRAST